MRDKESKRKKCYMKFEKWNTGCAKTLDNTIPWTEEYLNSILYNWGPKYSNIISANRNQFYNLTYKHKCTKILNKNEKIHSRYENNNALHSKEWFIILRMDAIQH